MEERRLTGGRLLKAHQLSRAEIARELGVSRATVSQWAKRLATGGLRRLRRRKAPGGPGKLTRAQKAKLKHLLKRGARAAGFETERWTLKRVRLVIQREFGVTYHLSYLSPFLHQLGWSRQQPLPRAQERDEELIRAWLAQDWPRIKKGATTRRRHRVL